jgi:hypothetical protein
MIEEDFFDDIYQSHGTSVASLVAANADNGVGLVGVCPGCSVMPTQGRAVHDGLDFVGYFARHGSGCWLP